MKPVKISSLKDNAEFKISDRPEGSVYILESKTRKKAVYTSKTSGRTYRTSLNTPVYPMVPEPKKPRSGFPGKKLYGTSGYEPSGY